MRRRAGVHDRGAWLLLAALLAGCACPVEEPPPLRACVAAVGESGDDDDDDDDWADDDDWGDDDDDGVSDRFSGTVLETGFGETPDGCFDTFALGTWMESTPDAAWARIEATDGTEWVVGALVPDLEAGDFGDVGDAVTVDYAYWHGDFSPADGELVVEVDDDVALWIGEAGTPADLDLPDGVTVAQGAPVCQGRDTCGAWSAYTADVTVDDETVRVPHAGEADVGPFRVVHGGYRQQTTAQARICSDWFVAEIQMALVRR